VSEENDQPAPPGEHIVRSENLGIIMRPSNALVDRGLRDIIRYADEARAVTAASDIFEAVRSGDTARVKAILEHDQGRATAISGDGEPVLCVAAALENTAVLELLIKSGPAIDGRDKRGRTALLVAAEAGHVEVAARLIAAGADVNAIDSSGATPLHTAVWRERFLVVELLLQKGANASAADHEGNTPLHGAAQTGQEGTAWLLVGADADMNAKNKIGETPFFLALKYHNGGIFNALCGSGAEIDQFSPDVFRAAAAAGDAAAMVSLGYCYHVGGMAGVAQDFSKAMEWIRKAAAAADADAMLGMGSLHAQGQGVPQDYTRAMQWWRKAAGAGNADAMYGIGFLYSNGQGVPQDYSVAMEWYRKAAAAGSADAMCNIGFLYSNGRGVPQDYSVAMEWYRKAAAAGIADAMCNIGFFYSNGQGVPRDYSMAMEWYRKGAAAGSGHAMHGMGILYRNGQGVPQDYSVAMEWYRKAAAAGNGHAMYNVGRLYNRGEGVSQDYAKAMEWYRKAATAGSADAMYDIGVLYENGRGVPRDNARAVEWWELAKNNSGPETWIHGLARRNINAISNMEDRSGLAASKREPAHATRNRDGEPIPPSAVQLPPIPRGRLDALPAINASDKPQSLAELERQAIVALSPHLSAIATRVVFGYGNPAAELMFVGDGPGGDEDACGKPFAGRSGQLLDKIIDAMGLRRADVYTSNILKLRTAEPGPENGRFRDRPPTPAEVELSIPWLHRQIEIIRPKVIVTLGAPALKYLTGTTEGIGRLRGTWFAYRGVPLMPTYPPSFLLRAYTPENRAKVWGDMQKVAEKLGLKLPR